MDKITGIFLLLVSVGGSFAAFAAVQRFFSPRDDERSPISDISDMAGKETSVFNKLEGSKNFWDKLDLLLVRGMGQEKKLEETYMLLGSPRNTDPLKMLHLKQILAVLLKPRDRFAGQSFGESTADGFDFGKFRHSGIRG